MNILTLRDFVLKGERFIVAHRGSSGTAPENTMAAFREALAAGAIMLETDIQMSSDDKVIIFHDAELSRTTNGSGYAGTFSYDELRKLDAGSWFDEKYKGEYIPLLAELIELIAGKAYLNLEIKSRSSSDVAGRIEKLLEIIYDYKFQDYTLFTSFDHRLIARLKKIDSRLHTGVINLPGEERLPSELALDIGADAYVCSLEEINQAKSEDARKNSIFLGVYSIDTLEDLKKAENYHIQAIVTNYPSRISELMGSDIA